jgi:hypothetical protein
MKWKDTPKEKKIFLVVAIVFVLIVIGLGYDFSRRTSSPWNKEKFEQKYRVK